MVAALLAIGYLLGRLIVIWRSCSLEGFGLGRANVPRLLWNPIASAIVWLIGHGLALSCGILALLWYSWWIVLPALALGYAVAMAIFAWLFRNTLRQSEEILDRIVARRTDESDASHY